MALGTVAAVLSLGLALVLTPKFGMIGLCLGLLVGRLVLTISYPLLVNAFLQHSTEAQPISWWRPLLVTMALFAFSAHVGQETRRKRVDLMGGCGWDKLSLINGLLRDAGTLPKTKAATVHSSKGCSTTSWSVKSS